MKNLTILVAMILFTCCVTAKNLESISSLRNEELQHYYPYLQPKHQWPFTGPRILRQHWRTGPARIGMAFPPLPAGHFHPTPFHPPPEVAKCLSDCKEVKTCFADIAKAFFTRKAAIGSDCCAAIEKLDEDCEKTVFGSFHNPFFNCFVKLHCSNKAGSSPAPSPA